MRFVFLGAPGAGKGTQASRAAQDLNIAHLATGDLLRDAIAKQNPLGKKVGEIVKSGALVSDDIMIALIAERLSTQADFILDGFPRTLAQGEALRDLLLERGSPLQAVIWFEANEDNLLARIKNRAKQEGRSDDNEQVFEKRLKAYHEQTKPLLAFYRAEGLIHPIDAMADIEACASAIQAILKKWQ